MSHQQTTNGALAGESQASEREPLPGRKEVAAYIGMTEHGLAQLHFRNEGPRQIRIGRSIRYTWADVDAWIASRTEAER